MRLSRLAALILTLAGGVASVQSAPELVTDRPDQTESASVVSRGYFQLELGWTHTRTETALGDVEIDSLPQTLARIGLTQALELRVGLDGFRWMDAPSSLPAGSDSSGLGDSSVGFKLRLAEERGRRPAAAVLATVSLPTGGDVFTSDRADPSFRISLSNTLTDRLSLGYNAGPAWRTERDATGDLDTLSVFEWTAALGIASTERLGFFIELFGEIALSSDGSSAELIDGGATYLLRDNLQLDASAGVSLSDSSEWFASLGVSFRLPR